MHAKIHTATSVLCVHFQFSFHRDVEVTHMHEHPKKSCCFWCIFFRPHKFLSFSLAALFKKNKLEEEEEEEEEEEKEEKKASNFQSCRLLLTTHTYKELAQRRRSKTERRRAALK